MQSKRTTITSIMAQHQKQETRGTAGVISQWLWLTHSPRNRSTGPGAVTSNDKGTRQRAKDGHQQAHRTSPCLTSPTTN
ncbi:hypothetical protein V8C26DRAFT_411406 [Trichoderma gracile]